MLNFIYETLDVCGKTFTVIPGYSVIFISLFLALAFAMVAKGIDRYWPLIPAISLFLIAMVFLFYKGHLQNKVSDTLLAESKCIDSAFAIRNNFFSYETQILTSKIPNDSIIGYQGNNKSVLEELVRRYEFGINGVKIDVQKANEIKAKVKRIEEENK